MVQSISDIAIVVCDDRGPDSEEAEKLVTSLKDSRLKFIRNDTNLGLGGNWNRCLDLAETDLVTILHADDRLQPHYASMMLRAATTYLDAAAFYCEASIIGPDSRPAFSFPDYYKRFVRMRSRSQQPVTLSGDEALASLLRGWYVMCPTLCYRRSELGDRRFSHDWRMVVDVDMIAGLLFDGRKLVGLPDVAYEYRRHTNNQTSLLTQDLTRFQEEATIYDQLSQTAKARGWANTAKVGTSKTIIKLNLVYCVLRDIVSGQLAAAQRKAKLLVGLVIGSGRSRMAP